MRNIGDHRWLNKYIGMPYKLGARGPDAADCYGLCKMIYSDVFGQTLPDWGEDVLDLRVRADQIAEVVTSGTWNDIDEPVDGCFVLCYRTRAAHHMGLYFAGGVIHSMSGLGAVYEPLQRFEQRFTRIVFGDWTP